MPSAAPPSAPTIRPNNTSNAIFMVYFRRTLEIILLVVPGAARFKAASRVKETCSARDMDTSFRDGPKDQTSDVQYAHRGISRFRVRAEPVIGPRSARTRWRAPE